MSLLGSMGMDEMAELKASISLEGNQLGMLKLEVP